MLGYDNSSGVLYLDRRLSGNVSFHPTFANVVSTPFRSKTSTLKLRVFVDQCAIEVFANDGERVLTSQIYPELANRGIELFSNGGATTLQSMKGWPLASIWP